jgi:hypothetical protein
VFQVIVRNVESDKVCKTSYASGQLSNLVFAQAKHGEMGQLPYLVTDYADPIEAQKQSSQ